MQTQPSDSTRAPISVSEYFENAFQRVFADLMTETVKAGDLSRSPSWEDDARRRMLQELAAVRAARLERVLAATQSGNASDEDIAAVADRVARTAVEIATLNTLMFWGQVKDDRWIKVGAGILARLEEDDDDNT